MRTGTSFITATTVLAIVGALHAPGLRAQTPATAAPPLAFDVASVKPRDPSTSNVNIRSGPGGRFTAVNASLRMLIRSAFDVEENQITGGPAWLNTDMFNIVAKADGALPPRRPGEIDPAMRMLQTLLTDRFKLIVHMETREGPIYVLTAGGNARPGSQLRPTTLDCASKAADQPKPAPGRPRCGISIGPGSLPGGGFAMTLTGGGITMSELARTLSGFAERSVTDRSGMSGTFDVELTWTPNQAPGLKAGTSEPPRDDPNGLSLFTAIQEQLGLKLESARGPIDVLVIDHVEQPTPD